ncbi:NAD(P)H-binding protein [Dyadobacter sp. CY345]|uniref:NAD(P)-dependent oxidoreductase n=1 Tax=Dyadobacter sp. CY345 TaxID=2909335 RepID=UPI001F345FFC|nr:NAD(P)H-binding protein [Dyadobacter sp. CY345]MCF2443971.1 NAD(P)H-binding protein [Dyadobacter sp. CY345]
MKMNLAIIGAGAGVGLLAVTQALENGHQVTALSTNTSAIPHHFALIKINGSATSVDDVKKAIQNADAVLITIGTKKKKGTTLFSDMAKAVITAMTELDSKSPVLVISGFGVGEGIKHTGLMMKVVINLFLKDQYKDKGLMESLFAKSNVSWEMVQPGMLTDGILTKNYGVFPAFTKGKKVGKISRADLAHYLITEAESPRNINRYVALTY